MNVPIEKRKAKREEIDCMPVLKEEERLGERAKERLNASTQVNALTIAEVGESSRPAVRSWSNVALGKRVSAYGIYILSHQRSPPPILSISRVTVCELNFWDLAGSPQMKPLLVQSRIEV